MKPIQRILLGIAIAMLICTASYFAGDFAQAQISQRGGVTSGGGGGGGGTVFIQNTPGFVIASALATIPISGNLSVGTVTAFIANTPGVVAFQAAALNQATTTATTLPNIQTTPGTMLPVLGMGYDSTSSNNAYRALSVTSSGALNVAGSSGGGTVFVNNTPAIVGSVSINNTPAIQGSVSINNTPAVLIQGSPGVVPFQAAALAQSTQTATTLPNVQTTPGTEFPVLSLGLDNTDSTHNAYRAIGVDSSGKLLANIASAIATVPVSVPTIGVAVNATIGVSVQNTPAVQGSVSINNTPAIQGSVSINNTPAVLTAAGLAASTSTATTLPNVQTTPATMFPALALGYDSTASNNAYRALSVTSSGALNVSGSSGGGTVFVSNTPAVLTAASLIAATSTATTLPNVETTPNTMFPALAMGYDSTASNNAYRALSVTSSGALNVSGSSGGGTVFVNNTPAIVGSVSINNTPAVLIQGSPGVVPFQAAALAQSTQTATLLPNVQTTPGTMLPVLSLGYDNTDTTHNAYRALSVDSSGFSKVNIASAIATVPVSVPTIGVAVNATIGVQMFNTPAIQGSVSINNTPAVLIQGSPGVVPFQAAALAQSTQTATTLPNVQTTPGTELPVLALGYDSTDSTHQAYRALSVDSSGFSKVNIASAIATVPVSVPTIGVAVNATIGVSVQNTPAVQGSVSINNTPAVLIQGSPGVVPFQAAALAQATTTATTLPNVQVTPSTVLPVLGMGYDSTSNVNQAYRAVSVDSSGFQKINIASAIATMPVSVPTIGVAVNATIGVSVQNTPAVQGSVSINNTPAVLIQGSPGVVPFQAAALNQATTTATTLPNVQTTPTTELPVLALGYDSTASNNAYRVISVDASGFTKVNIASAIATVPVSVPTIGVAVNATIGVSVQNTPAVQGSVSINNTPAVLIQGTPAIQGSVSINNTPAVLIQGTPAIQGSVSINNTPAVIDGGQGSIGKGSGIPVSIQGIPGGSPIGVFIANGGIPLEVSQIRTNEICGGVSLGAGGASVAASITGVPGTNIYLSSIDASCDAATAAVAGTMTINAVAAGPGVPGGITFNVTRIQQETGFGWAYARTFIPPIPGIVGATMTATIPAMTNGGACTVTICGTQQ